MPIPGSRRVGTVSAGRPGARKPRSSAVFWELCREGTKVETRWRREWDSNPRYARAYNGFRDRPVRPLRHPSGDHGCRRPSGAAACDSQCHRHGQDMATRSAAVTLLLQAILGSRPPDTLRLRPMTASNRTTAVLVRMPAKSKGQRQRAGVWVPRAPAQAGQTGVKTA